MNDLNLIETALKNFTDPRGAVAFFSELGYPAKEPISLSMGELPEKVRDLISSVYHISNVEGSYEKFQIFYVELRQSDIRRSFIRRFLEAYYRHYPIGENLFVFSARDNYNELVFVSPRRLPDPRNKYNVRLWLRILQVRREQPYRTDLEILNRIRVGEVKTAEEIRKLHDEAFSVEKVTKQFYNDYSEIFHQIRDYLKKTHKENGDDWAWNYTHQLLNRIMFIYFIARKGWLTGPDEKPDRDFMKHFWNAYREAQMEGKADKDSFYKEWLSVLFFEAFNRKWQNRDKYLRLFPEWLRKSFGSAPYLNGGLYLENEIDDKLSNKYLPDKFFELLFEKWIDNISPGLFERYNFTVVETGRFDEEVAVDPEMLGMVYENLVNVTFEETDDEHQDLRGGAGIFYTSRTEIDLMCRLSLVKWLSNQLGNEHKDLFYRWVFAFSEEEKSEADSEITAKGLWENVDKLIKSVRVCDPACGSGSFLVGMLLVLDELQSRCNSALGISETPYERRKRILRDQLYGVDVMEWAVHVAELRLWLQLVVETELHPAELHFKPLLPNLTFKLRPGDSLLQTVGDIDLSYFRRSEISVSSNLKGRLTQLKGKKRRFFQGEESNLYKKELIEQEEINLFRDILKEKILKLDNQIKMKMMEKEGVQSQLTMFENNKQRNLERIEKEIEELASQKERMLKAWEALKSNGPSPFVWDLAFVEIFEDDNPGFDIVIGNPPYVRQEKIRDHLKRFSRDEYIDRLNESLRAIYPAFMGKSRKISRRSDYYVYFYLHALSLLADKGVFCFITSNSWLDVDFGKELQEFFLRHGDLYMVIDNRAKRSFSRADVNTVIVLAGQPERDKTISEDKMRSRDILFVAFRVPFEEVLNPVVFSEIEDEKLYSPLAHFYVLNRQEYRAVRVNALTLWREGLAEEDEKLGLQSVKKYEGNKWGGKYLRAPDIYFTILEKGKDKLVRLGEIAEVRRGFTTGADDFFYLEPVELMVKEVDELRRKKPMALVRVKNDAGWEGKIEVLWLRPVIKSPKEIKTLKVQLEDLRYLVFMPPDDVRKAIDQGKKPPFSKYPKAFSYIRWGERQGYPDRPTCKSRQWWWDLHGTVSCALVLRATNDRPAVYISKIPIAHDQTFYGISECEDIHISIFNSTLVCWLVREILSGASSSLGLGATWAAVYEITNLLVLNPILIVSDQKEILLSAFDRLSRRPVRSIFEELGFALCRERRCEHPEHPYENVKPKALTLEQVQKASPDRFELDSVVFDVLGLDNEERLQVYQAVAQLVKERLVKARSVKSRKKRKV